MTEPIPPIQSAYLNIQQAIKNCAYALEEWMSDDPKWNETEELLQWAIEDLQAAKGKVQRDQGK